MSSTTKVLTDFDEFLKEVQQKDKVEFLLYYMTKPEYQIHVREKIYLDNMLDLF